jgi:Flp pilus assembly pilin Flp
MAVQLQRLASVVTIAVILLLSQVLAWVEELWDKMALAVLHSLLSRYKAVAGTQQQS